jgi:hypothetical protein
MTQSESELSYHLRRARQEDACAARAHVPRAIAAHLRLRDLHRDYALATDNARATVSKARESGPHRPTPDVTRTKCRESLAP